MIEIWKPVLGWEGLYEISNWGRVRSCSRMAFAGRAGTRLYKGRFISSFTRQGRYFVNLFDADKRATCTVHRLVLEAFVSPRPEGKECRHLDGNPANNKLENLTWGTKLENEADKFLHGTANRVPLTDEEVDIIRSSAKKQQELADEYGVTQSLVSRIQSRQRRACHDSE